MAYAMTLEQGKPIAQSRLEILRGCEIMEWDAQEGRRIYGRIIPGRTGHAAFGVAPADRRRRRHSRHGISP